MVIVVNKSLKTILTIVKNGVILMIVEQAAQINAAQRNSPLTVAESEFFILASVPPTACDFCMPYFR